MASVTANETAAPLPPAPEPGPEPAPARTLFHVALGFVYIPFVSVFVTGLLMMASRTDSADSPLQRRWKRRLLALLAVDLLVAAAFVWVLVNRDLIESRAAAFKGPPGVAGKPAPRIGIVFGSDPLETEPRVAGLLPGSPAQRAGLRPGDLIERIDGVPVTLRTEVQEQIRSGAPGVARVLTVRRGDDDVEISVTPELPPEARGLFEPNSGDRPSGWLRSLAGFLPAAALLAAAAFVARRKARARVVVWRGFVLASVGSFAAAVGTVFLFRWLQGGSSLGATLVSLAVQTLALLGLTEVATRWCGRDVPPPPDPPPPMSRVRAFFLGGFYLITGLPRVSIVLMTLDQLLFRGSTSAQQQSLEVLARSPLGLWGTLLFVGAVALVGPLAEERLFRGFLLPRLAAAWGSLASILLSAALFALFHPHYSLFVPVVFLYGCVFAWARLRTGGLTVPVLLHMMVNGLVKPPRTGPPPTTARRTASSPAPASSSITSRRCAASGS
jgi:membrane protease YdiL (CAAX protease family)